LDTVTSAARFSPAALVAEVAARLEKSAAVRGGLLSIRERQDLEPETYSALANLFPGRAFKDRKVVVPGWRVGRVDAGVWRHEATGAVLLGLELKWCSSDDNIHEGIWDLFKMALLSTRAEAPRAFLVTGANEPVWKTGFCADLFETRRHDVRELCARRFPTGRKMLVWDATLAGGYDSYPTWVPSIIDTCVVGRSVVQHGKQRWEIRAVEVVPGKERLLFKGGWPNGVRPIDAKRPLLGATHA
jgi:hypothetical protein